MNELGKAVIDAKVISIQFIGVQDYENNHK
jgi:hypothetical protein